MAKIGDSARRGGHFCAASRRLGRRRGIGAAKGLNGKSGGTRDWGGERAQRQIGGVEGLGRQRGLDGGKSAKKNRHGAKVFSSEISNIPEKWRCNAVF